MSFRNTTYDPEAPAFRFLEMLIESFYSDIWGNGNEEIAHEVLHPNLRFRGSIGDEHRGIDGFWEYFQKVRGAFGEYHCEILNLVTQHEQGAARMYFSGYHRRPFLGFEPLNADPMAEKIGWHGSAFFEMRDDKLYDIWVLGDLDGLRNRLSGGPAPHQVTVYYSLQSPYCYLLNERLYRLSLRAEVDVTIKPVRPGVIRLPDVYRDRTAQEQEYFTADVQRTAEFVGQPFAEPTVYPVEFEDGLWVAAPDQPRIGEIYDHFMAACDAGEGMEFADGAMRSIWSGYDEDWQTGWRERTAHLELEPDPAGYADRLKANEEEMYAAGHWGVPLMVYRGEAFYGQDRFDQLEWRIEENS